MKKIISLFLTVCLIISICTFMQIGVSAATNGVCGDNLTYTLDDNGILTISGTGAMYDDVWSFNYDGIKKVIVNEGVTTIGEFEFMLNETIDDVILPNGLTSIGLSAFNTTNIKRIFIPKSVTNIGRLAFFQCGKLTDVYYAGTPEDWTKINIGENNDMWLTQDIIHFGASGIEENDSTQTPSTISVKLDNVDLVFDQSPMLINDRTMVPIRVIFEAMGYTVEWNAETQTARSIKGNDKIIVQLNNNVIKYTVNGEVGEYVCDVVPQIVSDRTLVPARAVAESAGCTVEWNGEIQLVSIFTK